MKRVLFRGNKTSWLIKLGRTIFARKTHIGDKYLGGILMK
jgi:hypothetical protein